MGTPHKHIRKPAVAGFFYPSDKKSLIKSIEECFKHTLGPRDLPSVNKRGSRRIIGLVCPHAGYMYSGPVAAHAYYMLAKDGIPKSFIILGPNHQGIGSVIATVSSGLWETPLGHIKINEELAKRIVKLSGILDIDEEAHIYEHSIEVQLPFLQYLYGDKFTIVPITMLMQDLESSTILGRAIAKAIKDENVVIIASTDFTHYEPHESAKRKDTEAIKCILRLDPEDLYRVVSSMNITMCGVGPVMTMLVAAKELGASVAYLLKYATSGDITGDLSQVVGYGAIAIMR